MGDPSTFMSVTNSLALDSSLDGRAPAAWSILWYATTYVPAEACIGYVTTATTVPQKLINVRCSVTSGGSSGIGMEGTGFSFSPDPFNTAAPPSTVTITGSGFDPTYGMPIVQYFDMNGNLDAQQSATTVSSDGTTLTLATPNFTELADGTYVGVISNIASDGSYQYVGATSVDVPAPFYRPTTYSDMAAVDPVDYSPTSNPGGPTAGAPVGQDDAMVTASDNWSYDQNGYLIDTQYEGQCTWSGFPSYTSTSNLTLYIPYYSMGGAAYYTVTAVIGGSNLQLYGGVNGSSSGVLTANVPAGTNLSTIQVTVNAQPENSSTWNPMTITNSFYLDIYVQ
jgi:hypothetical protein